MLQIIVLYGGASAEHEVSCRSAAFILNNLDRNKYIITPVAITKSGAWCKQELSEVLDPKNPVVAITNTIPLPPYGPGGLFSPETDTNNTVVFPIIHGTDGEDGKIQGLLEMANIKYVGCDSISSGVGFDKVFSKKMAHIDGIPIVEYTSFSRSKWLKDPKSCKELINKNLKLPIFVKPVRQGSSVGISKVTKETQLDDAINLAFQHDTNVLIERAISARELECAILSDGYDLDITDVGEIRMNTAEFYDYEAKYLSATGADIIIPAEISKERQELIKTYSKKIFECLNLYGMVRIDFFLENSTGNIYFNEVNTIPGFTSISQYPQLWKAKGVEGPELLDRLIQSALNR